MGCCGEPSDKSSSQELNRVVPFATEGIAQQPSPQPGISWEQEKLAFQQPIVPSPQPVLQYGGQYQPSFQQIPGQVQNGMAQPWTQSQQFDMLTPSGSPPPPSPHAFGNMENGALMPSTRTSTPSTYVANPLNGYSPPPLTQPTAAHHSSGMSISGRRTTSPPTSAQISGYVPPMDEGKLSVSIDFGEYIVPCHLKTSDHVFQVPRSLEW